MNNYTQEEFDEFEELVELSGSHDQMDRIYSRLQMPEFIRRVGKAKCDEMWKVLNENN